MCAPACWPPLLTLRQITPSASPIKETTQIHSAVHSPLYPRFPPPRSPAHMAHARTHARTRTRTRMHARTPRPPSPSNLHLSPCTPQRQQTAAPPDVAACGAASPPVACARPNLVLPASSQQAGRLHTRCCCPPRHFARAPPPSLRIPLITPLPPSDCHAAAAAAAAEETLFPFADFPLALQLAPPQVLPPTYSCPRGPLPSPPSLCAASAGRRRATAGHCRVTAARPGPCPRSCPPAPRTPPTPRIKQVQQLTVAGDPRPPLFPLPPSSTLQLPPPPPPFLPPSFNLGQL